jgi:N-acetylglutamate synthase-like GNAT family acetyltransferase
MDDSLLEIKYTTNQLPNVEDIIALYKSSGINRPVEDVDRIRQMYSHSNLVIAAWHQQKLVGIFRSLTDFNYCCYLSDLAVDKEFQKQGIGKKLIALTQNLIGDKTMLLLLAVPSAMEYYPNIGFEKVDNGFVIKRKR